MDRLRFLYKCRACGCFFATPTSAPVQIDALSAAALYALEGREGVRAFDPLFREREVHTNCLPSRPAEFPMFGLGYGVGDIVAFLPPAES